MRSRRIASLVALLLLLAAAAWLARLHSVPAPDSERRRPQPVDASPSPAALEVLSQGADPTGIAVDAAAGKIYWAETAAGRIRSANLDGSAVEIVVDGIDAPVGVAVDQRRRLLYWTTDGAYPRKVQRSRLDGSGRRTLAGGTRVNRPSAIAVDAKSGEVYWSESVAGRIRRKEKGGVVEVVDSGVSSTGDREGSEVTWALGIALDAEAGKLYWTELTSGTIQRANLDGTAEELIVAGVGPCDAPAGITVDRHRGRLYWADSGCGAILSANLDGSEPELVVEGDLIAPHGIAVDSEAGRLYWTDVVTEKVQGITLSERTIADLVRTQPSETAEEAEACARAVRVGGRAYAAYKAHKLSLCLEKVGAVKAVKRDEADAAKVARSCLQLGILDSPEGIDTFIRSALESGCREEMPAGEIDGTLDAYTNLAWQTVASRIPRALEWVEEVRPFIEVLAAERDGAAPVAAALSVLDQFTSTVRQPVVAESESSAGLPASGQTTTYPVFGQAVPDDGALRAGARMGFRDNGDGTISDLNTGLIWEKKCDCPGSLHDFRLRLSWSDDGNEDTIWDWLERVRSETPSGFAGHSDWRIPNAKELVSIIDYERFNPAVGLAFDGPLCGLGCADLRDPRCSCTTMKAHWSSTSFADDSGNALAVGFHLGLLGDMAKDEANAVRAVRGGQGE